MKKYFIILLLFFSLIKSASAVVEFDWWEQGVWFTEQASTTTILGTFTVTADRWLAGDFHVGISTEIVFLTISSTGVITFSDGSTLASATDFSTTTIANTFLTKSSATATYLPFTGGTMTGNIDMGDNAIFGISTAVIAEFNIDHTAFGAADYITFQKSSPITGKPIEGIRLLGNLGKVAGFQFQISTGATTRFANISLNPTGEQLQLFVQSNWEIAMLKNFIVDNSRLATFTGSADFEADIDCFDIVMDSNSFLATNKITGGGGGVDFDNDDIVNVNSLEITRIVVSTIAAASPVDQGVLFISANNMSFGDNAFISELSSMTFTNGTRLIDTPNFLSISSNLNMLGGNIFNVNQATFSHIWVSSITGTSPVNFPSGIACVSTITALAFEGDGSGLTGVGGGDTHVVKSIHWTSSNLYNSYISSDTPGWKGQWVAELEVAGTIDSFYFKVGDPANEDIDMWCWIDEVFKGSSTIVANSTGTVLNNVNTIVTGQSTAGIAFKVNQSSEVTNGWGAGVKYQP